jgi:hypothetical protein
MALSLAGFAAFIIWMAVIIALGFSNDHLLARIMRDRTHRVFVGIGVIIHESSHWMACKLTGTKVFEVALFEASGGHVKHEQRGPVITAFIGLAPVFGGSIFLIFLAWLFGLGGVRYSDPAVNLTDPVSTILSLLTSAGGTLWVNLSALSMVTLLFLLFLYLVWSMVACIAPSRPDLKNAAIGAVILSAMGALVIYIQPLSYLGLGISGAPALEFIVSRLTEVIGVGIIMTIIPLLIAIPIALLKSR